MLYPRCARFACLLALLAAVLAASPALCGNPPAGQARKRSEAAQKASLAIFHKESSYILETDIIGYALVRTTPEGDIFFVNDLTRNSYFLFPTTALPAALENMLRESYLEGKFIKLSGLVVAWKNAQDSGQARKASGFFVDSGTTYEWADPVYEQMRAAMEQEKEKLNAQKQKASREAERQALRRKKDPTHSRELEKKLMELKRKQEQDRKKTQEEERPSE